MLTVSLVAADYQHCNAKYVLVGIRVVCSMMLNDIR